MSNGLLNFAVKHNVAIIQKYLEPGHTQMECDSVHSCIERKLKRREISLPSDYVKATREARSKPMPYEVVVTNHDFFKDYSSIDCLRYSSIRPGKVKNDAVVTDLRMLCYNPDGVISYKLDFDEELKPLPSRPRKIPALQYPRMHKQPLKISENKWKDLQELKSVLPKDCHHFYDLLPH